MQELLVAILVAMRANDGFDATDLGRVIRRFPRDKKAVQPFYTKAEILAFWKKQRAEVEAELGVGVKAEVAKRLEALLRVKPVRTQSGVATITVLTKPWPCPGQCIFCPSDVRMPKSYLSDEPGAQRAEINFFDPYLQVISRLQSLAQMGHDLDKIELIVLGGTWDNYPLEYQRWFIGELFRALNESHLNSGCDDEILARTRRYGEAGLSSDREENARCAAARQKLVNTGQRTYNEIIGDDLQSEAAWQLVAWQTATWAQLEKQQRLNETAPRRCVGLVIETRPDNISPRSLLRLRRLGCTKVQMGVQSVNDEILRCNGRGLKAAQIAQAFALLRLYGFKIHAHFMANLLGATPESDQADFATFVTDGRFLPDEIKVYPCSLIESAVLMKNYRDKSWRPYSEAELLQVLAGNLLLTPVYARVTRMIRDISSHDIVVGNKKTNFRQLVEQEITKRGLKLQEIRSREIKDAALTTKNLRCQDFIYETSVSTEHFLHWLTPQDQLAGFLRLSLPCSGQSPFGEAVAMIREVHIYGTAAPLSGRANSQHLGLGKKLIARAKKIAIAADYTNLLVISAVGTREYYRRLGFVDKNLYQSLSLTGKCCSSMVKNATI